MIKNNFYPDEIKQIIHENVGRQLLFKVNTPRRKNPVYSGILKNAYGGIFVIQKTSPELEELSFSYSDIISKRVVLKFMEEGQSAAVSE